MKSLLDTVRALSLSGEVQLASQPARSAKADELALGFHDAFLFWKPRLWAGLSEEKKGALAEIDSILTSMSSTQNSELWTDEAVLHDPRWSELREKARRALVILKE